MISTLHVRIDWAHPHRLPILPPNGFVPSLSDPRVLRGAWNALTGTPGVVGCDLVSTGDALSNGRPYFVVAVSDATLEDPALEDLRLSPAALHDGSVQFSLVWASGGGIKTALVDLRLEII